ncbi:MAG: transporter substrate-binding domain-containing protein [Burkholderiaceae bacterium]|nr:transporter substrate-binding domain-containing protein [Burkholderiaceae bacterium]
MVERRLIRALVPSSKTFYYVEKGRPSGVSYDVFTAFEQDVNKSIKSKALKVRVVFLPTPRDEIIDALVAGNGDVVFADMTITPARRERVDFSDPMYTDIHEVVVTAPGLPPVTAIEQLSGQEVFVRPSTSYHEHLVALNARFKSEGKKPVVIRDAPEELESEDILEMVNAGLVPHTVVDRYKAEMWSKVFTKFQYKEGAVLQAGGEDAFMLRKDSPQLMAALNAFVKTHRKGTQFGNSAVNRYVKSDKFVRNAVSRDDAKRFGDVVALFKKYGNQYDVDHLLMMAQSYQESGLDHNARSAVGAIGIMQIMPATGKDLKVGDIKLLENNINGGVKYMRFMIDRYYKDEPMTALNKGLFTFASYNAGPARIASLRREAAKRGLDPNRWFGNVELVAADKIGAETVTYVSNIYKYYTAYKLLEAQQAERAKAREQVQPKQ